MVSGWRFIASHLGCVPKAAKENMVDGFALVMGLIMISQEK